MPALPLCVKTPKGVDEVERRTCGLPLRARQVLIMVDGKRDHQMLSAMFPGEGFAAIFQSLWDDGFIAPLVRRVEAPSAPARPPAPPPESDAERFAMARNFMLNTTSAFAGLAASSLATHLEASADLESLRQHFHSWREAIQLSRDGRKRLDELETKLAALLS
jgi:hypothetical protein